ncbi:MAG: hypothetical protein QOH96_4263 [Blastocatellia bacterium]|nr:hypothetical protein [Blastocatellia bacterium]
MFDFRGLCTNSVFEDYAASKPLDCGLGRKSLDFRLIYLFHIIARCRDEIGQITIICKYQQPFSIEIETANGIKPAERLGHQIRYKRTTIRISHAGKIPFGFIQKDVDHFARLQQRINQPPAYLDMIAFRIGPDAKHIDDLTVDGDLAREDHLLSMPPRSEARHRNNFL